MSAYEAKPDCDRCGAPYYRHSGDFRFCPFVSTYRSASAIEARRAETHSGSVEDESAGPKDDAQPQPEKD
jgi:uncharacterized Zn finger protein (UPF0148 family)